MLKAVRYYRHFGFFQGEAPAEEIVESILRRAREEKKKFDPADEMADAFIVESDPSRVARVNMECVQPWGNGYVHLLLAAGRIFRGAFSPTDIKEVWRDEEAGPIRLSFAFQGKRHAWTFEVAGYEVDKDFFAHVNDLMDGSAYQLYSWTSDGDDMLLFALTPQEKIELERQRGWRFRHLRHQEPREKANGAQGLIVAMGIGADRFVREGDLDAALKACGQGLWLNRHLVEDCPKDRSFYVVTGLHLEEKRGGILLQKGEFAKASESYRKAREFHLTIETDFPDAREEYFVPVEGARARHSLAICLQNLGSHQDALPIVVEAIDRFEALRTDMRYARFAAETLGSVHELHGDVLRAIRRKSDALAAYEMAERSYTLALPRNPKATSALKRIRQKLRTA